MTRGVIFPELISGREDDASRRPWTVREGSTMRGAASCNLTERILEVPLGPSNIARVVRAHELMHARVSPHPEHLLAVLGEVSPRALECAEELRVNTLLGRLNFDVSLLRDGTERLGARRLSDAELWDEAVCFFMAVIGTGAEREFLTGIRQGQSSWLPALRALRKRVHTLLEACSTEKLSSTGLSEEGVPRGYADTTLEIARLLTRTMNARVPRNTAELKAFRRSLEVGGRRAPSGRFAPLVLDISLEYLVHSRRKCVRRQRAATTGTHMRYPGRLLTDDQRRVFGRRVRRGGGVIVIDQSGSMDLVPGELQSLLRRAPDALVLGYSHRPGDLGRTPNVWLVASRRGTVSSCPPGNVGNGVDGPVLRWALTQRQGTEPVVWVTDGQVTDSHDHPDEVLTRECAELVRRHRIRLVRRLNEVAPVLRMSCWTPPSRWDQFGRVGRYLDESSVIVRI